MWCHPSSVANAVGQEPQGQCGRWAQQVAGPRLRVTAGVDEAPREHTQWGPISSELRGSDAPGQRLGSEERELQSQGLRDRSAARESRGGGLCRGLTLCSTFMTGWAKYRALQSQKPVCIVAEMKLLCPASSGSSAVFGT